jgi:hypothetical protein
MMEAIDNSVGKFDLIGTKGLRVISYNQTGWIEKVGA